MRTTQSLVAAEKYANGSPVFKGDPDRIHTSEMVYSVTVTIVKSPEGAMLYGDVDEQFTAAMQRRKFGQIGAVKTTGLEVSSSEILYEAVTPVKTTSEVLRCEESFRKALVYDTIMDTLTMTEDKKPIKLSSMKATMERHRKDNDDIRKRWIQMSERLKSRKLTPEEIKRQKAEVYKAYVSPSLYMIVVSQRIVHIVNKPSLKGTVFQNVNENYYNLVNYKESKVRKTATTLLPIISVPVTTLQEYETALKVLNPKVGQVIQEMRSLGLEDILNSNNKADQKLVKFDELKAHDTSVAKR